MDFIEWKKLTEQERYIMLDIWGHMPYEGEFVSIIDGIINDMLLLRCLHELHYPATVPSETATASEQDKYNNVYSVYFDASATPGNSQSGRKGTAGLGYEISGGKDGGIIHSDSKACKYRANTTALEAAALNFAAHAAATHLPKGADVIFYGDNSNSWDLFRATVGYENTQNRLKNHFCSVKFSHINRNGNKAAHKLAYKANRAAQQCKQ